ncbi:MAG: 5'-methylthioadenosine/adenosylhomocysteine nucleosidase [Duncaniella sp.]|nr:5'-methylthioadenosine/adenosylhomocysteine nucleosidase [Duncaniella sp.]
MKIGIIVAMEKELKLLLPLLENRQETVKNDVTFHIGTVNGNEVIAMQCGIGKVNAAMGTLTLIDLFEPEIVINTGVAGGTGSDAGVLDVVIADRVAYHDFWCLGEEWGQVPGCPKFFNTVNFHLLDDTENPRIKRGLIASGDLFVSKPSEVEFIRSIYPDVKAVDMESAAIAQVCHLKGVLFYCMRVISDTPGGADNISQYENFWEDAPRQTFDILHTLLSRISDSPR